MTERFDPDWIISPGEILRDWLDENGLTPKPAATACGLTYDEFSEVLTGDHRIDDYIAEHLAHGTGIPARLWLNLERAYRNGLAAGKKNTSRAPVKKGERFLSRSGREWEVIHVARSRAHLAPLGPDASGHGGGVHARWVQLDRLVYQTHGWTWLRPTLSR